MINYHLLISGRVQGVGFRWSVLQLARQMRLCGFVKNLPNGQVYLEVQGPVAEVEQFCQKTAAGPTPYARVTAVQKNKGQLTDYHNQFFVTR